MACQNQSQGSSNTTIARSNVHPNRTNIGWKYCHLIAENDTNNIVCNYCSKVMKGGITRVKQHLIGKRGNVLTCDKYPKEVREELWAYEKDKKKKKIVKHLKEWC